jgi:hypothetical protein
MLIRPCTGRQRVVHEAGRWRLVVSRDNADQEIREQITARSLTVRNSENVKKKALLFVRHDTSFWLLFCLASWAVC